MGTRDRLFWMTTKVRPWFQCPWTGDACPDRVDCIRLDTCWQFEIDKASSLSEPEKINLPK